MLDPLYARVDQQCGLRSNGAKSNEYTRETLESWRDLFTLLLFFLMIREMRVCRRTKKFRLRLAQRA